MNEGYIYKKWIMIARTVSGAYVALSTACPHAGGTVDYIPGSNCFLLPKPPFQFLNGRLRDQWTGGEPIGKIQFRSLGNIPADIFIACSTRAYPREHVTPRSQRLFGLLRGVCIKHMKEV